MAETHFLTFSWFLKGFSGSQQTTTVTSSYEDNRLREREMRGRNRKNSVPLRWLKHYRFCYGFLGFGSDNIDLEMAGNDPGTES
jgi:hypothetical protein